MDGWIYDFEKTNAENAVFLLKTVELWNGVWYNTH